MSDFNQYQTPQSQVDVARPQEYGEVKIFGVSGRLGRLRYLAYSFGISMLVMFIAGILSAIVGGVSGAVSASPGAGDLAPMIIIIPAYLFVIVYQFMVAIQRCHDFNASGWLSILILIPFVSLIFLFIPGTKGENDYGPPPPPNSTGVVILALIIPIIMVVGILAAIAIPAYQGYIERAQQQQMEQQR